VAGAEVECWLCGSRYRPDVDECFDCPVPLGPITEDQRRIRALADDHLDRRAWERVRPALAALPDVLVDGESVVLLTDARHAGKAGVLAVTDVALCWVPVDVDDEAGAIALDTIQQVDTWPGDGGQVRVDTAADLHVFAGVGREAWLGEFAEAIRNAIRSRALRDWGRASETEG
jgi:hypothetical protein